MSALTVSKEDEARVKGMGFLNNRGTDLFSARVLTVNGKVTAAQHRCMAEAAEKFGNGNLLYTTRLSVEIQGIPYDKIEEFQQFIAKEGLVTGGTGAKVRPVVSCKGTTCQYGLLDSYAISEEIYKRFYEGYRNVALPHKFKIAVGGCPNNCVKPNLNDVGIIGQKIPQVDTDVCKGCKKCAIEAACQNKAAKVVDGKIQIDKDTCRHCGRCVGKCPFHTIEDGTYGYKIYIGGRWGKKVAEGKPLSRIFTSEEEVLDMIIPKYMSSLIFGALQEAVASENGARMTAMDSATNNAEEMLGKLELQYNRARQGSITQELTEIIAGANAIN